LPPFRETTFLLLLLLLSIEVDSAWQSGQNEMGAQNGESLFLIRVVDDKLNVLFRDS